MSKSNEDKYVYLSHAYADESLAREIDTYLTKRGYRVWRLEDHITGNLVEATAQAIENSHTVLCFMSRSYKESTNCRTELTYAVKLKVKIVFLLSERGFIANGWLGSVLGQSLYYDVTDRLNLQATLDAIVAKELPPNDLELEYRAAFAEAVKSGGSAPWMRSKLMMVGEGRAGKSSTVRSFLNKPFDAKLASTVGADTSSTVSVERQDAVNWSEQGKSNQFDTIAARAAAIFFKGQRAKPVEAAAARRPSLSLLLRRGSASKASFGTEKAGDGAASEAISNNRQISAVAAFDEKDMATKYNSDLIAKAMLEEDDPTKRKLTLSIWDYGGQEVFYALHHIFLTQFGVYVVVFDMCRLLKEETQEYTLTLLRFWIRSIHLHASNAPIFLAGTRKDVVRTYEDHVKVEKLLVAKLNVSSNRQIIRNELNPTKKLWFYPIDNSVGASGDATIAALREKILESIKDKKYVTMSVPLSWIQALDKLMEKSKSESLAFMPLEQVMQVAESARVERIHVKEMLTFFNQLGVLCYFENSEELCRLVILEPQWMVNAMTKVIRDFDLHGLGDNQGWSLNDDALESMSSDIDSLQKRGIITKRLLNKLWENEAVENQAFLISLMKRMSLMCSWKGDFGMEMGSLTQERFLIPSLYDAGVLSTFPENFGDLQLTWEATFELNFQESFLPSGLFARLIALIVEHAHDVYANSRVPWLSRLKAVVSFGEADFFLEQNPKLNTIRVDVFERRFAREVLELLPSMIEKLRDEVLGVGLKWSINLMVSSKNEFVSLNVARKNRDEKYKRRERSTNQNLLDLKEFELSFFADESKQAPLYAPAENAKKGSYHVFLSYNQGSALDTAARLSGLMKQNEMKVWYDQDFPEGLTEAAMMQGVDNSKCLLMFLSKGVMTRPFCQGELRRAIKNKKPILFVHEDQKSAQGYAEIYEMRDEAPEDLRFLFKDVESLPFRRRKYEVDSMMNELSRRIQVACEGVVF